MTVSAAWKLRILVSNLGIHTAAEIAGVCDLVAAVQVGEVWSVWIVFCILAISAPCTCGSRDFTCASSTDIFEIHSGLLMFLVSVDVVLHVPLDCMDSIVSKATFAHAASCLSTAAIYSDLA